MKAPTRLKEIRRNKNEKKIKVEKILHVLTDEDFPDDRYVVGKAQGKYFFSWGKYPENGMVPCEDVAERGAGIRWYDLLSELRREELRDFGEWRVFEECEINGIRFAILVDDIAMESCLAYWREEGKRGWWETDFGYQVGDADMWDVAENLDVEKVRALGYRHEYDPEFVEVDVLEVIEDSPKNFRIITDGSRYGYVWGPLFPFTKEVPSADVYTSESGVQWFWTLEEARNSLKKEIELFGR